MKMGFSGKSLIDSVWMIVAIVGALFALIISTLIYLLIGGSVANVATSGDVPLEGNFTNAVGNVSAESAQKAQTAFNSVDIVIVLIVIVVIIAAFGVGYLLKGKQMKGGSKY